MFRTSNAVFINKMGCTAAAMAYVMKNKLPTMEIVRNKLRRRVLNAITTHTDPR